MALLKFKRSAVSGKAPALGDLELGELAINTFDGKVYMRKDNGTASIIEVGGGSGVLSFNSRTGAVTLSSGDVTTALGFTPANKAGDTFTGLVTVSGTGLSAAVRFSNTTGGRDLRAMQKDDGRFVITDETASAERLSISSGGSVTALTDIRTPILYDSNDTNYYIDPNSSSVLNTLYFRNSSGTNILVGNSSTFGYSSAYRTLILGNQAYTTVCIGVDPVSNTSGSFNGAGSGVEVMFKNGVNFITPNSANNSYHTPLTLADGYAASTGSFRAPIFYDSNNTAYYLDPASTGISGMINGEMRFGGGGSSSVITSDGDFYSRRKSSTSTGVYYFADGGQKYHYWDGGRYYYGNAGPTDTDVSFRAPIFYDLNDTAYFADPNSTSNFYRLSSYIAARDANANWNTGFQNTPAYSYNYHGDLNGGTNAPAAGWWFYESMRHSNASNYWGTQIAWGWEDNATRLLQRNVSGGGYGSWVEYLNTSNRTYNGNLNMTGSIISTSSDVRAPIFYDQNNTGYYANPNGNSVLFSFDNINQRCSYSRQWDNYPGISVYNTTDQGPQGDFRIFGSAGANGGDFSVRLLVDGNVQSLADLVGSAVRAQIFYDTNDTSAYVDPAGASWIKGGFQMNVASPSNDVFGGLEMREAGLVGASQSAATYAPGINFHWGSRAAARLYMDASGHFVLGGQGDITNNRRNLSGAAFYANNWFRSYGTSGWYNETYEGGIWMNDVTWVRVYNSKRFLVDNELAATGNITAYYSDERLKTKIGSIDNALEKLAGLDGFLYVENELARSLGYKNEKQQVGVSAQAVQAVLPEAVSLAPVDFETLEDGTIISKSGENYLTVDYSRIVPLLIEAIKELNNKVETLEASIRSK